MPRTAQRVTGRLAGWATVGGGGSAGGCGSGKFEWAPPAEPAVSQAATGQATSNKTTTTDPAPSRRIDDQVLSSPMAAKSSLGPAPGVRNPTIRRRGAGTEEPANA